MAIRIENLSLKVEVLAGTTIADACREAVALANHLRLTVDFNFNRVTVMTKPGVDPEDLERAWRQEMESKSSYKFACVQPKEAIPRPCPECGRRYPDA